MLILINETTNPVTAQLIVSILTLILTPIFTVLIVNYRLKKRQTYWKTQQNYLKTIEINRLKIETYREAVELINEMNNLILKHQIYASNRDVSSALSNLLKNISPKDAKSFSDQFDVQKSNAESSYLEMRELSAKISGLGVRFKVYFDQEIFDLFTELKTKIKIVQQNILSREEVTAKLSKLIEEKDNWREAKKAFDKFYDSKLESVRPVEETNKFLDKLMEHFDELEE